MQVEKEGSETVFFPGVLPCDGRQGTSWLLNRAAWPVPCGTVLCDSPSRTRLHLFTLLCREPCRLRSLLDAPAVPEALPSLAGAVGPATHGPLPGEVHSSSLLVQRQEAPHPTPPKGPASTSWHSRSPGKCAPSCQRQACLTSRLQYPRAEWVSRQPLREKEGLPLAAPAPPGPVLKLRVPTCFSELTSGTPAT